MSNRSHFKSVTVSAAFTTTADVIVPIRNPMGFMFVCTSGTNIEYSFDGSTVHGRISANQIFQFQNRNESTMWFRGTGAVDVHVWATG